MLRMELTADQKLRWEAREVSLTEMDQLSRTIAALIEELIAIGARIDNELPVWPDKQYLDSRDKDPAAVRFQFDRDP